MADEKIRISKFISDAGLASRREADRLIEMGEVEIKKRYRQEITTVSLGEKMTEGDRIFLRGKEITAQKSEKIYIMLNKPRGLVCTSDRRFGENVIDYLKLDRRVTYLGRLDKDSCGLLLLSNDGELNNALMRAANAHEKEYEVLVNRPLTPDFLQKMQNGVAIYVPDKNHVERRVMTRRCRVKQVGEKSFHITLTQGLNRQIRRMCLALGYEVRELKRFRIGCLVLGDLEEGKWRYLEKKEIKELEKLLTEDGKWTSKHVSES